MKLHNMINKRRGNIKIFHGSNLNDEFYVINISQALFSSPGIKQIIVRKKSNPFYHVQDTPMSHTASLSLTL